MLRTKHYTVTIAFDREGDVTMDPDVAAGTAIEAITKVTEAEGKTVADLVAASALENGGQN